MSGRDLGGMSKEMQRSARKKAYEREREVGGTVSCVIVYKFVEL